MHLPLGLLYRFPFDPLFERIYVCGLEVSRTNFTLEEDVELSVRPTCGLRTDFSKLDASNPYRRSL